MSGSSTSSPPRTTEVTSSRRPQSTVREKNTSSSSRSAARPARGDQRVVRPRVVPIGPGAPEARRDPPRQADPPRQSKERLSPSRNLFDGSDRPDVDSLQRRRSRVRSTGSASTPSAPQEADSAAALRRLQSLLIWGGGALDVHVSHVVGRGQGPTLAVAEVRRSAPPCSRGSAAPLSRWRVEVWQPPSQWASSAQPPSRVRRAAW
jgi:hypothetical protein